MQSIQFPFTYNRLNRTPLDVSDVFDNLTDFQTYLATGPAYVGQIVAVRNVGTVPDVYRINEDYTYSPLGVEGTTGIGFFYFEQEDGNLYFVADIGVRPNMFEYDDPPGDLYYVFPEAA